MFWKNFLQICNDKNTTPTAVVSELGISRGSVTGWKKGSVPNDGTLLKLADYFGVSVDYLLGNEEKEKVPSELPTGLDEKDIKIISKLMTMNGEDKELALSYMQFLADRRKASQENQ